MSGENIPYHLRPNKFVDRALFIDILAHINRHSPISEYLYVSFAGPYLEDFKAIHANFGNRKMLSLEQFEWVYRRQTFNVPYGCVDCTNNTSQQFITDYTTILDRFGRPNVLIWLDYAAADAIRDQLTECEALVAKLRHLDVMRITLNATPSSIDGANDAEGETDEDRRARRLQVLQDRIRDYLPNGTSAEQMKNAAYPSLLLHSVRKAASNAMAGAGALVFHPLAAYVYKDSHQMLTVTGIVLARSDVQIFLNRTGLDHYEFATNNWRDSIRINVPYLSPREKFYLDSLIYKQTTKNNRSKLKKSTKLKVTLASTDAVNKELAERYIRFYRYYPHYHRVHY
jgi:hypothetical protein